jgi:methylmalonyl-CoA carboxyltransferase large subunit
MKSEPVDWARVIDSVEALRQELARLSDRVAVLEANFGMKPGAVSTPPGVGAADTAGLNEELVLVIGAAIAAFLGKKPHIRQIRLLRSDAWAQQGRVTVQASHALPVPHR